MLVLSKHFAQMFSILKAEILNNPFMDIIPRKKEQAADKKTKKSKKDKKYNFTFIFGRSSQCRVYIPYSAEI